MKHDRRSFITAAASALAAGPAIARTDKRPNVLLIIVDQMRQPRWTPKDFSLPAYDRLREEGLSFNHHFTSAVPCSPSRASLMTGRHLPQHGMYFNIPAVPGFAGAPSLDPSIQTMGHAFRDAGYRTPYFGKWHLTNHDEYWKDGLKPYGFEAWHGPDGDGWPLQGIANDRHYTDRALGWMRLHGKDQPWFLTLSLINPHDIMYYKRFDVPPALVKNRCDELPGNFADDLGTKPSIQNSWRQSTGRIMGTGPKAPEKVFREFLDFYYYLEKKADKQIERVLDALDKLGLSDNTIVVFTSDHGEMAGSHRLSGKGPFLYNENNQVPLVLRWPATIRPGSATKALTQSVDVFPTLAELAGVGDP